MKKPKNSARQVPCETQRRIASATPATHLLKPSELVLGSSNNARHHTTETQSGIASATPASTSLKPIKRVPGSPSNARHDAVETQKRNASATPAERSLNSTDGVPGSSKRKGRQKEHEVQSLYATSTPAIAMLKSTVLVPGSIPTARQHASVTHFGTASAAPAKADMKPTRALPGSSKKGRQLPPESHVDDATSTSANHDMKSMPEVPGSSLSATVEAIRAHHRERRFAMGIQQVLDRKLESYIRINKTEWHVGDDETARTKANKEVAAKIKAARADKGDPSIVKAVRMTDHARGPADAERARHEKEMTSLARSLPVASWVESVPGFGLLGLATIVAETGDLSNYANVAKVWKRLGYAPYKGRAGSSWKRPSWHKGDPALTKEEWIANPFAGLRYSMIHVVSVWLKNKQWVGAAKSDDGVGKPNGRYGEIYAERRAHTADTHPDWTKQHSHIDGLRIMMKEVLKDLWIEWNQVERKTVDRHSANEAQKVNATIATPATRPLKPRVKVPGSSSNNARHPPSEAHNVGASATPANDALDPNERMPGSTNARYLRLETQCTDASATPATRPMKPIVSLPGSPIHQNGRQLDVEAHTPYAAATPASNVLKPMTPMPGSPLSSAAKDAEQK